MPDSRCLSFPISTVDIHQTYMDIDIIPILYCGLHDIRQFGMDYNPFQQPRKEDDERAFALTVGCGRERRAVFGLILERDVF